jgi:hypothetical protein
MRSSFEARVHESSGSTDAANVMRVMSDAGQAPTPTLSDIAQESRRVVAEAGAHGDVLRITGSVAFHLRVGDRVRLPRPPIQDIDLVAPSGSERRTTKLLTELGYWGEREFNARHGASRLVFWDRSRDRKLEVFLGNLVMCHTLPIADRLGIEKETVPLAELILTKLQIVQLNEKDVADMHSLLIACDVGRSDSDEINAERIAELCAKDWGLHHTVDRTLDRLGIDPPSYTLTSEQREAVSHRISRLRAALEAKPKSVAWRLRAKVGERVKWYEEPEEINAG